MGKVLVSSTISHLWVVHPHRASMGYPPGPPCRSSLHRWQHLNLNGLLLPAAELKKKKACKTPKPSAEPGPRASALRPAQGPSILPNLLHQEDAAPDPSPAGRDHSTTNVLPGPSTKAINIPVHPGKTRAQPKHSKCTFAGHKVTPAPSKTPAGEVVPRKRWKTGVCKTGSLKSQTPSHEKHAAFPEKGKIINHILHFLLCNIAGISPSLPEVSAEI